MAQNNTYLEVYSKLRHKFPTIKDFNVSYKTALDKIMTSQTPCTNLREALISELAGMLGLYAKTTPTTNAGKVTRFIAKILGKK